MDDKDLIIENLRRELTETRQFRQVVMFSPNPLLTLDDQGRMVFCNKACEDLIGHLLADVAGKHFGQLFLDSASAERVAEAVAKVFQGKTCPELELTIRREDGGLRHTLSRAYPIYSPQHTIDQCAIANADITDLKLAQQALKDSEERYKCLSDSSFEGIVITQDGIILDANENVVALGGYALSELIGMNVGELVAAEHRSEVLKHVMSDITRVLESTAVLKDGSRLPVEVRGKIIPYKGGTAKVSAILDISERWLAERAFKENSQRLQAIFESVRDCIFVKDRYRKYVHVNPAMTSLLRLSLFQIVGRTSEDIFGESVGQHLREVELRVLDGESIEQEHTRPINGEPMTFLDTLVPLFNYRGEIYGICGISRNITERKRVSPASAGEPRNYISTAMKPVMEKAGQIAAREGIVLLLGESGTGKDHLARWIHEHSRRSGNPFFSVNCAALPQELAESELFGHESGAFTGAKNRKRGLLELAEGGTLLLNEIGELTSVLQSKLLSFLDTRSFLRVGGEKSIRVDARIIAATHRDLEKEVEAGRFLQSLFYRLNVFSITIPPLRERFEDIPILVETILSHISAEMHLTERPSIDSSTMAALARYDWPGNVRELRNVLERALMLWDTGGLELLPPFRDVVSGEWSYHVPPSAGKTLHELTKDFRRSLCLEMIRRFGNKKEAAKSLGISRYSIYRYIGS
jgi:PAS domain S-box-containing protein